MVTYIVVGFFVLVCVVLLFGHSRLLQLENELRKARKGAELLATAENDVALDVARDNYNRAVASFPTNLAAMVTGFARTE